MNFRLLFILLMFLPMHVNADKWYQLASPSYKVIAELDTKPGKTEIISIKANKATHVGFMAKITPEEMKYYESINIKPITVNYAPEKIAMYGFGGSQAVIPVNNEIILEIKNNTNENILVHIYKD